MFFSTLNSVSVSAKHHFQKVIIFNCTPHKIRIPQKFALYKIDGISNFPSESGEILKIQNLENIICLPSQSLLFQIQESQIYEEKGHTFMLTCFNYLAATLQLFNPEERKLSIENDPFKPKKYQSLFPNFPFTDLPEDTRTNTYFNVTDEKINKTRTDFGNKSADHLCRSQTCINHHEFAFQVFDNTILNSSWCNHSKINISYGQDSEEIVDLPKRRKDRLATVLQQPATVTDQGLGPATDIWPQHENPISEPLTKDQPDRLDQIFGDLQSMEPLRRNKQNRILFVEE